MAQLRKRVSGPVIGVSAVIDGREAAMVKQEKRVLSGMRMVAEYIQRNFAHIDGKPSHVVVADELIKDAASAQRVGRQLRLEGVEVLVCYDDVWAYPGELEGILLQNISYGQIPVAQIKRLVSFQEEEFRLGSVAVIHFGCPRIGAWIVKGAGPNKGMAFADRSGILDRHAGAHVVDRQQDVSVDGNPQRVRRRDTYSVLTVFGRSPCEFARVRIHDSAVGIGLTRRPAEAEGWLGAAVIVDVPDDPHLALQGRVPLHGNALAMGVDLVRARHPEGERDNRPREIPHYAVAGRERET